MGVCAEQHRQLIGKYNSIIFKKHHKTCKNDNISVSTMLFLSLVAAGLIFYLYVIILTMAMYISYVNVSQGSRPPSKFLLYSQQVLIGNALNRNLLNKAFINFSGYFLCFL